MESLRGASKAHPTKMAERAARLSAEVKDATATARERLREAQTLLARLPTGMIGGATARSMTIIRHRFGTDLRAFSPERMRGWRIASPCPGSML